ncbi:MAG: leucine-rich repeat protein [Herbinix sp.]|jgi:internalin A|nr:leucine-rich repeat protein [Herbinix sp.]
MEISNLLFNFFINGDKIQEGGYEVMVNKNYIRQEKSSQTNHYRKNIITFYICLITVISCIMIPVKSNAVENGSEQGNSSEEMNQNETSLKSEEELHGFYPSNTVFSEQIQKYIDNLDSVSFAWSRIDSEDPTTLNTMKGRNGNNSFYYPTNYLPPVEYAHSKGKSIQLNIYMDRSDCTQLLPYDDKRASMIQAIMDTMQTDLSQGKGIFYDGVVIDFEGLRNTDTQNTPLFYEGKEISIYFTQFLAELKTELRSIEKKLYVAVNPGLYYDGYDYADILDVADRVILMAHDYEPTEQLQKNEVQQYTGYDALEPINSMAPVPLVRKALNEMASAASDQSEMEKVWLQITFDSAQWQYDVKNADAWVTLKDTTLSREGRVTPLYKSIKARVDNTDGKGQNISYGYNNELQSPYIQYFNSSDKSWNIILYEDSNSIRAKIDLAKSYGLGGISLWSLANVPDYTDTKGLKYHLDGWSTIVDEMKTYHEKVDGSSVYVSFKDVTVEKAVRDKLGKVVGKITVFDLQGIYRLKLPQGVKSLVDLKYLSNLEYLDAGQLGIKDITVIEQLKNLRVLYLQRNKISNLDPLKKLTKLELLSLNGNQIVSIKALSSLTNLKELYLRENKIESITSLSKLTKLEILEIGVNSIIKIDALKNLKKLQLLGLDNNKITDIQALKGLVALDTLYLQRNSISDIGALAGLSKIRLLSLNGNKLYDLKPLTKLTSLEKLYLKDNKIKTITALKGLINLKELYLSGNQITDYSSLKILYLKSNFDCDFKI